MEPGPKACWLAVCLAVAPAAFAAELGPGVEEVQRCMERNLPERTARQKVVFERRDRAGNERRIDTTVWWKRDAQDRSRMLALVEAPPDERGTGFLMIEGESGTELFSYLPELGRVRRVTSRSASSFLGTDLSFEDLEELQTVASRARVERLRCSCWRRRTSTSPRRWRRCSASRAAPRTSRASTA